jgi:hypothetical protein
VSRFGCRGEASILRVVPSVDIVSSVCRFLLSAASSASMPSKKSKERLGCLMRRTLTQNPRAAAVEKCERFTFLPPLEATAVGFTFAR